MDFLKSTVYIENDEEQTTEEISEGFIERWRRRILTIGPFNSTREQLRVGYTLGHYNLIKGYANALESGGTVPVPLEEDRDVVAILEQLDHHK
jgi:hypothetical protein